MSDLIEEIKRELKTDKLCFGAKETKQAMRDGTLKRVFVASNSTAIMRADLEHLSKLTGTPVELLPVPNDELGVVCKKQFSISVLGEKK